MTGRLAAWFGLACLLSWPWAALGAWAGDAWGGVVGLLIGIPFVVGPALASWVWARWVVREPLFPEDFRIRFNGVLVAAWVAPVLLVWAAAGLAHLGGWGELDISGAAIVDRVREAQGDVKADEAAAAFADSTLPYAVLVSLQAILAGMLYAPVRMVEEVGWRGVVFRELQGRGFWVAAVVAGLLWGVWRVPLAIGAGYFPGSPWVAAVVTIAAGVPFGAVLAWLRVRAGTVWASAAFQGTLTALGPFHELVLRGGSPVVTSPVGVAGALVAMGAVVVLFFRAPSGPEPLPEERPA